MERYNKTKKRVYEIIEKAASGDLISRIFDYIILSLIILNTIAIILESFDYLAVKYKDILLGFEILSVVIFTFEYFMRLWTADIKYNSNKRKISSRLRYIFSFMALIDLFAILPFYLPMIIPFDLRFLRILRLTRLLRIFKINRYSKALRLIGKVVRDKKEELLATIFIMGFLILIAATLIYYFESEVQPDSFPNIVASFWWAVATLTTVGYGDVYPITGIGKILAGAIAILGIGIVALPTGIISSGFMDEITNKNNSFLCPHCGEHIHKDNKVP